MQDCWTVTSDRDCKRDKEKAQAAVAQLVQSNNQVIAIATAAVGIIATQLIALLALVRLIPLVGPAAAIAVRRVQQEVAVITTRLATQKAANDAVFQAILRAAA